MFLVAPLPKNISAGGLANNYFEIEYLLIK